MDRPVQSCCDDGIRRGIDDRVIARILPVTQDTFARNGDRDIADLQYAIVEAIRRERAHDDIVQQVLPVSALQWQQPVQRVRQDA